MEHEVTSSMRYFSKKYPEFNLKEANVRRIKKDYLAELKKRRRNTAGHSIQAYTRRPLCALLYCTVRNVCRIRVW